MSRKLFPAVEQSDEALVRSFVEDVVRQTSTTAKGLRQAASSGAPIVADQTEANAPQLTDRIIQGAIKRALGVRGVEGLRLAPTIGATGAASTIMEAIVSSPAYKAAAQLSPQASGVASIVLDNSATAAAEPAFTWPLKVSQADNTTLSLLGEGLVDRGFVKVVPSNSPGTGALLSAREIDLPDLGYRGTNLAVGFRKASEAPRSADLNFEKLIGIEPTAILPAKQHSPRVLLQDFIYQLAHDVPFDVTAWNVSRNLEDQLPPLVTSSYAFLAHARLSATIPGLIARLRQLRRDAIVPVDPASLSALGDVFPAGGYPSGIRVDQLISILSRPKILSWGHESEAASGLVAVVRGLESLEARPPAPERQQQQSQEVRPRAEGRPRLIEMAWEADPAPSMLQEPPIGPVGPGDDQPRRAYPCILIRSGEVNPDVVVLEKPFEVIAGLSKWPDGNVVDAGAIAIPKNTEVKLDIVLAFDPKSLEPLGPTRATLTVNDANPYPTFQTSFVPLFVDGYDSNPPSERRIGAYYFRDGQLVGIAWRSFLTVQTSDQVAGTGKIDNRQRRLLNLGPLLNSPLPDLIVTVTKSDTKDDGRFIWTAFPGSADIPVPDKPRSVSLGAELVGFAQATRRKIQATATAMELYLELAGKAKRIGDAIPSGIKDALRAVVRQPGRQKAPTLLLLTEELIVPWELADIALSGAGAQASAWGGTSRFLGAHFAIGRWPLTEYEPQPSPPVSLTVNGAAVLTADYKGGAKWGALEHAVEEAKEVAKLFQPPAREIQPELLEVVDLLRGKLGADVIHVALHGQFDVDGNQEGIVLLDSVSVPGKKLTPFLSPDQLLNGEFTNGPLVFLNACQVGTDRAVLGSYGGFASTLLRIGAGAVVAPLWNIDDAVASMVAERFYNQSWTADVRLPSAEAIRQIRTGYTEEAVRGNQAGIHATLIAFQVFGHPNFTLTKPN